MYVRSILLFNIHILQVATARYSHVELQRVAESARNLPGLTHEMQILARGIAGNVLDRRDGVRLPGELVVGTQAARWLIAHGQVVLRRCGSGARILTRLRAIRTGVAAAVAILTLQRAAASIALPRSVVGRVEHLGIEGLARASIGIQQEIGFDRILAAGTEKAIFVVHSVIQGQCQGERQECQEEGVVSCHHHHGCIVVVVVLWR